jgi:hypothetical protein
VTPRTSRAKHTLAYDDEGIIWLNLRAAAEAYEAAYDRTGDEDALTVSRWLRDCLAQAEEMCPARAA